MLSSCFNHGLSIVSISGENSYNHGDVIKWKHFYALLAFVRGIFFDLRLNKRLSKQSRHRWFEMLSCSLWRHCNVQPHCIYKQPIIISASLSPASAGNQARLSWHHRNYISWKVTPYNWICLQEISDLRLKVLCHIQRMCKSKMMWMG